ncbi:MAG: Ig-like domain-containing protein, partial [Solirubrobacterales bacterium]
TWHANENGSFELRVGGADCTAGTVVASGAYANQPATQVSNVTAAQLAEGANTLRLCITDAASNRGSATTTLTKDTGAPDTTIGTKPAALANSATANFTFTGNDGAGSGIASFECRRDGGAWSACTSPQEYTSLAEGAHSFEVKAIDQAGNVDATPASFNWSIDSQAPTTTIETKPEAVVNSGTASFTFSGADAGGSGIASFECHRDGGAWSACTSPHQYTGLPDGAHSFEVKAIDQAGNADATPASFAWTVDTMAPAVQIDSGPSGLTNDPTPTFQFSSELGASFECSIDEGTPSFGLCSGPNAHTPAAALANGPHTFRVRATDAATNQATATRSFTVDTSAVSPPELTATVPASPANDNNPEIVGTASAGTTVRIYANASCTGTPLATGTAAELAAGIEVTVVDNSSTSFRATATTTVGNVSPCSEPIFYVEDSGTPDTEITLKPASPSSSSSAKFEFAGNDGTGSGIASFECRRGSDDPAGWASCVSPKEYTGLSDGAQVFEVRAIDAAGNTDGSPASFAWVIDTTPEQEQPPTGSNPLTDPGAVNVPEFVRVLRNKKKGTAMLIFKIPSPGLLSARAPEIGLRRPQGNARTAAEDRRRLRLLQRRIKPRRIRIVSPGQVKVPIELTPVGMKLLTESHRLKVDVVVRFKAADGSKATWKIAVTLEKALDPEATEARHAKK